MSSLIAFRGLRPPRELVEKVACPPYDVVSREEAAALAKGNPQSFFHVSRPEIDLPAQVDEHDDRVYAQGATNLKAFREKGWLVQEAEPRLYAYRQKMGSHVQLGLVAAASVDEYQKGLIKKHELTRADKEDDRTRHLLALDGNDEPVFVTYRADRRVDALMAEATSHPPEYDFVSDDGIGHTFWVVPPRVGEALAKAFEQVPSLYIADGHHRSAAALRARDELKGARGSGRFLAVVFPHDQMQILDYNRVVKDLAGKTAEEVLAQVRERFDVEPTTDQRPTQLHRFGMYLHGRWWRLTARPGTYTQTPMGSLDVSILQENLLRPVLNIGEVRTDPRIGFVGGIRGPAELEHLVNSGKAAVAFSMFPTRLEQLMAIADAGEIMPPKSTWFEPKLRSGLVLHPY